MRTFPFRSAAVALLMVAALDIGVPGHALTDPHERATQPAQAWCGGSMAVTSDHVATSGDEAFHHDDCFGCCANILPEHMIRLWSFSVEVPSAVEAPQGDLPPLTTAIFHPPNA